MRRPIVLIILDGWGINPEKEGNAIAQAKTPVVDDLLKNYPSTTLRASGEAVGLPEGQMGNSEVGHLNLGAGRIIYQEFSRISKAIEDGSFFKNKVLLSAIKRAKENNSNLHFMGLLSDGGVHSHITHLYALLELAKKNEVEKVYVHCLLDGRDVGPNTAPKYIKALEKKLEKLGVGRIATIMGRYYGMDRDRRWDRTKKAYEALIEGQGRRARDGQQSLRTASKNKENDEFVIPTVVGDYQGIEDRDIFLFFNFRADRARQITRALTEEDFKEFKRGRFPSLHFVCFTEYDERFDLPIAFPSQRARLKNVLAQVLSNHNLKQLHLAETEKYAHVTFFFNGGRERPFKGEDRILISSPKVATYDLKPEMSAERIADKAIEKIDSRNYNCIIMNFANPDMVGHTGIMEAAIKAIETVDGCLGRVVEAIREKEGIALVTADHGNAEKMIEAGEPHTAHTCSDVFFILVDDLADIKLHSGILADVAPTILDLLKIEKPKEMTGKSLIVHLMP